MPVKLNNLLETAITAENKKLSYR